MLSSRWHFLLLLLQVLPSSCDYESWERQRELDKKREMVSQEMCHRIYLCFVQITFNIEASKFLQVSQETRRKEEAEERIAQVSFEADVKM